MTDHAPLLERAFELELSEDAYMIDAIEGEVPAYLRGDGIESLSNDQEFLRRGLRMAVYRLNSSRHLDRRRREQLRQPGHQDAPHELAILRAAERVIGCGQGMEGFGL